MSGAKFWRKLALRALGDHGQWSWPEEVRLAVIARALQTKRPDQRPRRTSGTLRDIAHASHWLAELWRAERAEAIAAAELVAMLDGDDSEGR